MLVDPQHVKPYPGTRMLPTDFGLTGLQLEDPRGSSRKTWTVQAVYAPVPGRALSGVRAKLLDEEGFISFINQRDLELLLELASPGDWCPWLGDWYPGVNDEVEGWYGICCDDQDLLDDLYERECCIRAQLGGTVPEGVELKRSVHRDSESRQEELWVFLWDKDPDTGYGPDVRMDTLQKRWSLVEKVRCGIPRR